MRSRVASNWSPAPPTATSSSARTRASRGPPSAGACRRCPRAATTATSGTTWSLPTEDSLKPSKRSRFLSSLKEQADPLAEIASWLGRETEYDGVDEVTLNDIRHKLEVYCFDCPLHYDPEVARAHGYRTVVAPVAMTGVWTVPPYWTPGEAPPFAPGLRERNGTRRRQEVREPFSRGFNAAAEWEAFEPLYPGDRLHMVSKLVKLEP